MDTPDASPPRPSPSHTLRVTFAYRGSDIRVVDSRRVEMIAPPVVTRAPEEGQTGYWVQLTDPAGRIVWHRPLASPIAADAEVFSSDRRQSIARVPLPRVEGRFSVLVPDAPDAADLSLHGPADATRPGAPAGLLLRIPVDALRKFTPPAAGANRGEPNGR